MFVYCLEQDPHQITSTPDGRENFLSLIHFLWITKILWHLRQDSVSDEHDISNVLLLLF